MIESEITRLRDALSKYRGVAASILNGEADFAASKTLTQSPNVTGIDAVLRAADKLERLYREAAQEGYIIDYEDIFESKILEAVQALSPELRARIMGGEA